MKRFVLMSFIMILAVFSGGIVAATTIAELTRGIDSASPGQVHTYYLYRSKAYFGLGDYERGLDDLNTSIGLNPTADAYLQRGAFYQSMLKYDDAIDDYTAALQLNKYYFKAYVQRCAAYYENKEYGQAIIDATYIQMFEKHNPFAQNMIEKCYVQMTPQQRISLRPADVSTVMKSRKGRGRSYIPKRPKPKPSMAKSKKPKRSCAPRRKSS